MMDAPPRRAILPLVFGSTYAKPTRGAKSLRQVSAHAVLQLQLVPKTSAPGRLPAAASGVVKPKLDVRSPPSWRGTSRSYRKPTLIVRLLLILMSSSTKPATYQDFQRGLPLYTVCPPCPPSPRRKLAKGLPEPQQELLTAAV